MTNLQVAGLILLVVIIVVSLLWGWYRSHIFKRANALARRVFPVWAAQGPFDSGDESAAAMRYAYLAVFGKEAAHKMGMEEVVRKHAVAYDNNPLGWEENRQQAILSANSETEESLKIAKDIAAMESPNYRAHYPIPEGPQDVLPWSSSPGAHEAHLIRRYHNPYFPERRREVSQKDLAEAKKKDEKDYMSCQQRLEKLGKEIEGLPPTSTSGELLALRERIDDLIRFSMGVGGPATEIASKADDLRGAVISDLRTAFSSDEETLDNIDKADAYHQDNVRKFYIPVVAQILRNNSPIPQEETIATILSEDPSAIAIFINSLPEDSRALIEMEGLRMLKETLDNGHVDPQCEEKIFALGGEWPMGPK